MAFFDRIPSLVRETISGAFAVFVVPVSEDGAGAPQSLKSDASGLLVSLAGVANLATAAAQAAGNALATTARDYLATMSECTLSPTPTGAITKLDATVYNPPLRAIWATGAGDLTLMLSGDTASVVTIPVAAGEKITFLSISRVMTATTATGISGAR